MERGWRTNTVSTPTTRPALVTHWTLRHKNSSTALWFGIQKEGTAERHTVIHLTYTYEQVSGEEVFGAGMQMEQGIVTSVSIDRCMQELDLGLPPAPTPFPGNLRPLWLVRTTAHTQKKSQRPTREAGGGMRRNSCPFKPRSGWESKNKPKLKEQKKGHDWFGWAAMEAGDLRRSCNTQNRDNSGPKLESKESPGVCTWELSSDRGYAWLHFHRIHMTVSVVRTMAVL